MKRLFLILGLVLMLGSTSCFAECNYTCVFPYDMNNKFSTFISKISGLNYARTQLSEIVLKKAIAKSVESHKKLKVDLNSYSAKDLANGIFKSMEISGHDVVIDGIYISYFELKSLCEFNYIKYDKKGNLTFKEDFPMSYTFKMSEDDINNSMKSAKYQKIINDVNKLSFAGVKVSSTEVSIRGNRFYYTIYVSLPLVRDPKKLEITSDIMVENGKINFENTRLSSNSFKFDLKKINFLMNYLNPLDFSVNIFNNKNAKVYIDNISIKNNEIIADGVVIIPKD